MKSSWLWLLAVAGPVAGGLLAAAFESDAWVVVTVVAWIAGPLFACLATWAGLARVCWVPRGLLSAVAGAAWSVVAILLWMVGVAGGEGAGL